MELSFPHNHKVSNLKVNSERVIIVFLISCRILTNSPQLPRGSSGPNQYKQNFVFCFTISAQDHITTLLSLMKERKREIVERKRENLPDRFATFKDVFREKKYYLYQSRAKRARLSILWSKTGKSDFIFEIFCQFS